MQVDMIKYLSKEQKIVVGVSGGPDSMYLLSCIRSHFLQQGRDLTQVVVVTCDHGTRPETKQEIHLVRNFADGCSVEAVQYEGSDHTERALRLWRHEQFLAKAREYGAKKIFLGHNLTDRVEGSLLNLCRGAGLRGFLSMTETDKHFLDPNVTVVRPLLSFSKQDICARCEAEAIPFVIDPTNDNLSFSQRNVVRAKVLPLLDELGHETKDGASVFLRSMAKLYQELAPLVPQESVALEACMLHPLWEAEWGYGVVSSPQSPVSSSQFVSMLKQLCIYRNVSEKVVREIVDFWNAKASGYKYWNGVYFFVAHGQRYVIKARKNFWENPLLGEQIEEGFLDSASAPLEMTQVVCRYPLLEDRYAGKTLNTWLSNQKVPFFWRQYVAVEICDGKITRVSGRPNFT